MKLITSSSPHIRSGETTRRLMGTVLLALLPTLAAGVWFFRSEERRVGKGV